MRIVFVCLGNICRSPLAEGVMRHLVSAAGLSDRVSIDSAGTGAWHAGEPPDPRSVEAASRHGVSLEGQRARQVADSDYTDADWLLAMDASNLATLTRRAPTRGVRARVELLKDPDRGCVPRREGTEGAVTYLRVPVANARAHVNALLGIDPELSHEGVVNR